MLRKQKKIVQKCIWHQLMAKEILVLIIIVFLVKKQISIFQFTFSFHIDGYTLKDIYTTNAILKNFVKLA